MADTPIRFHMPRTGTGAPRFTSPTVFADELVSPAPRRSVSRHLDVEAPSKDRRSSSCFTLAGTMARAMAIGTMSLIHQFLAQGVGVGARAAVQTGLVGLATQTVAGLPLAYPVAAPIAAAITVGGILLATPTAVRLASGTISALAGRAQPVTDVTLARGEVAAATIMVAIAVVPAASLAMGPSDDEGRNLGLTLLILQAGRTVSNLVRDSFTQSTRRALPSLEYTVRPGYEDSERGVAVGDVVKAGSEAFEHLIVTPRAVLARLIGTMGTYAAVIYAVNGELKPLLKDQWGIADAALGDGSPLCDFFTLYAFDGFASSLIEGFDGFTTVLSIAFAAWCGGAQARFKKPEGYAELTPDALLTDIGDNSLVRVANAVFTVEAERGFSRMRGLDSASSESLALQTFALTLTHLRGFTVETGRHFHKLHELRQARSFKPAEAPPSTANEADEEVTQVRVHPPRDPPGLVAGSVRGDGEGLIPRLRVDADSPDVRPAGSPSTPLEYHVPHAVTQPQAPVLELGERPVVWFGREALGGVA